MQGTDKGGKIIEFESIEQASKEMKMDGKGISWACHGNSLYRGYLWKFQDK